ncbi:hypothetical protein Tco_0261206 [Tanacetum coccineum]
MSPERGTRGGGGEESMDVDLGGRGGYCRSHWDGSTRGDGEDPCSSADEETDEVMRRSPGRAGTGIIRRGGDRERVRGRMRPPRKRGASRSDCGFWRGQDSGTGVDGRGQDGRSRGVGIWYGVLEEKRLRDWARMDWMPEGNEKRVAYTSVEEPVRITRDRRREGGETEQGRSGEAESEVKEGGCPVQSDVEGNEEEVRGSDVGTKKNERTVWTERTQLETRGAGGRERGMEGLMGEIRGLFEKPVLGVDCKRSSVERRESLFREVGRGHGVLARGRWTRVVRRRGEERVRKGGGKMMRGLSSESGGGRRDGESREGREDERGRAEAPDWDVWSDKRRGRGRHLRWREAVGGRAAGRREMSGKGDERETKG